MRNRWPVGRLLAAILVWALLLATTAAFVVTEVIKLERPPVGRMRAPRSFSPVCECAKETARLSFRLRRQDALDVAIVDDEDNAVRTLATGMRRQRGRLAFRWGGRDDAGALVPDGRYRLRVALADENRTVTFRRTVTVDTHPPELILLRVDPTRLTLADNGISIRLQLSERSRVFLLVDGKRRARLGRIDAGTEEVVWPGTVRGRALEPGRHRISLRAQDPAGNRSQRTRALKIELSG